MAATTWNGFPTRSPSAAPPWRGTNDALSRVAAAKSSACGCAAAARAAPRRTQRDERLRLSVRTPRERAARVALRLASPAALKPERIATVDATPRDGPVKRSCAVAYGCVAVGAAGGGGVVVVVVTALSASAAELLRHRDEREVLLARTAIVWPPASARSSACNTAVLKDTVVGAPPDGEADDGDGGGACAAAVRCGGVGGGGGVASRRVPVGAPLPSQRCVAPRGEGTKFLRRET